MLNQHEREMEVYFKKHRNLMAPNVPQMVFRNRVLTKLKYFILQNATGIIRECNSSTKPDDHVILNDERAENDDDVIDFTTTSDSEDDEEDPFSVSDISSSEYSEDEEILAVPLPPDDEY